MAGSAFIEIETDFEYVQGELNEQSARFLMDFYHVQGELDTTLTEMAHALTETAKDYLELQGIERNSNLANGIIALKKGPAIELRSSAYRMPTWGRKDHGGADMVVRHAQEVKGHPRMHSNATDKWVRDANKMIMPQEIDYVGAAGGHYSLVSRRVPGDTDAEGNVTQWMYIQHGGRYGIRRKKIKHPGTKNVQYYGAHVEFGHRTRNDGGIGFVQARPHLRPALRTVADASTGWLSTTMAFMLQGIGNNFDSLRHQGRNVYGLNFGNRKLDQSAISGMISRGTDTQRAGRALALRRAYSINRARNSATDKYRSRRIGFGKNINYERYGYNKESVPHIRQLQRNPSGYNIYKPPKESKHWFTSKEIRELEHFGKRYKYRNSLVRKSRKWDSIANKRQRSKNRHTNPKIRARRANSRNKRYTEPKPSVQKASSAASNNIAKNTLINQKQNQKGQREPNKGGANPLKPTRPEDFMRAKKPSQKIAQEAGMDIRTYEKWQEIYRDDKADAERLSELHNDRYLWLQKYGEF